MNADYATKDGLLLVPNPNYFRNVDLNAQGHLQYARTVEQQDGSRIHVVLLNAKDIAEFTDALKRDGQMVQDTLQQRRDAPKSLSGRMAFTDSAAEMIGRDNARQSRPSQELLDALVGNVKGAALDVDNMLYFTPAPALAA